MYLILLLLHLLGAAVWVGGYLTVYYLSKNYSSDLIHSVYKRFHPLGMTSLVVQLITGIILANHRITSWTNFDNTDLHIIYTKIAVIIIIIALVGYQSSFLKKVELNKRKLHIYNVLIIFFSITMVILGVLFRL